MEKPRVSVIMSVYNGEEFLKDSILSILKQTYKDFEFLVVDDASVDGTSKILEDLKGYDSRIKVLKNIENLGLTKSLNKAIAESTGEYVARLDSGDLALPERIEKQVAFLDENKNVGLVGSWVYVINQAGEVINEIKYSTENKRIKRELIKHNPFVHSSIMFRRSVAQGVSFYDEDYKYAQDYNFYFKLLPHTEFANIPNFLIKYRVIPSSITLTKNKEQILSANRARMYAIKQKYYTKFSYFYVLRNYLLFLLPSKIKFFIKKII